MNWGSKFHAVAVRAGQIAGVAACLSIGAYVGASADEVVTGLNPVVPQPPEQVTQAGLAVTYWGVKVRWIDEFVRNARQVPGMPGEPLLALNYPDKGAGAKVLGTRYAMLVGAMIDGMLHLDVAGEYQLAAVANDGIRIYLDGKMIVDDPGVRPSEFTDITAVNVDQPGWYQLHAEYFQRKGTAALEFYWKRPDQSGEMVVIPASAYAHIPE